MVDPPRDPSIVMRLHRVRSEVVLAACDEELLGRQLPVGSKGRTVTVSAHFYGERVVSQEELRWALHRCTIANLLGVRVLAEAEKEGVVPPGGHGTLGGVPHAEIVTMTPG
jgi:uncharacterized protein